MKTYESNMKRFKPFTMRRQFDDFGRCKIEVIEGYGFDENPKKVIFWLPASSVDMATIEGCILFNEILHKRIAKEFDCKIVEIHCTYLTGNID